MFDERYRESILFVSSDKKTALSSMSHTECLGGGRRWGVGSEKLVTEP